MSKKFLPRSVQSLIKHFVRSYVGHSRCNNTALTFTLLPREVWSEHFAPVEHFQRERYLEILSMTTAIKDAMKSGYLTDVD